MYLKIHRIINYITQFIAAQYFRNTRTYIRINDNWSQNANMTQIVNKKYTLKNVKLSTRKNAKIRNALKYSKNQLEVCTESRMVTGQNCFHAPAQVSHTPSPCRGNGRRRKGVFCGKTTKGYITIKLTVTQLISGIK